MTRWSGFLVCLLLASCREITEPAYIEIQAIPVVQSGQGENSTSSDIKDAWIYLDDNLLGIYELPCRIPVTKTGKGRISVGAGVWMNALPTLRSPYVFYRFYEEDVQLNPGKTLKMNPAVKYKENIHLAYQAGFDSPTGNTLEPGPQSDTLAGLTNDPARVFEGQGSFQSVLYRDEGFVEYQQAEPVDLPKSGAYVFLELDYLSSHPVDIGIRSYYPAAGTVYSKAVSLPATASWQKVYINLTSKVSTEVNAQNFRTVYSVHKESGTASLDFRMDNIRLIHFNP